MLTLTIVMESPSASPAFGTGLVFASIPVQVSGKITLSLVFYFRQVPLLSDARITEILEVGICLALLT